MIIRLKILILALILPFNVNAETVKSFSLYNKPKYNNFLHFDYVNPNAIKGGEINMPDYGGFDSFNPYIFKGNASSEVASLMIESLGTTAVDDRATLYPLIAKSFKLAEDKSYMDFNINEKAKFSDGSNVNADDVAFSFNVLVNKGSPVYKMYYSDIIGVKKIADNNVRFLFNKNANNKELPIIAGLMPIFSKNHFKNKDFSEPSLTPLLGSGPYTIYDFEQGKYIKLKRNPNYWAKDLPTRKGHFNFDKIKFDFYLDTTVSKQALFAGNIDVREEYMAKIWATGYDNDLVKSKQIIKAEMEHDNPPPLQNFAFNIRKHKFKDKKVRQAINLAFDFDWANKNLFYNQYKRLNSYFTNTGYEYENFFTPPHSDYIKTRENLKTAVKLLNEAGYDFVNNKMTNIKSKEPLEFEILGNTSSGASFTRVMLPFIKNLKKIGIGARFRNAEVNVFKNKLDNFDYDIAIISYGASKNPGNELREFYGSQAADVKGGYNYIGIKNKTVDKLIKQIISANDKTIYAKNIKALDNFLLNQYYMILNWYSPKQRVAYWNKFEMPKTNIKTGFLPHTWWIKNDKKTQ